MTRVPVRRVSSSLCDACPRVASVPVSHVSSCKALVRRVSPCAGMMIRPRAEGLDVTFNVTQSQTWHHYVRALHQFLERESTGRHWEGTGRALVRTGRHWEGLGGHREALGGG